MSAAPSPSYTDSKNEENVAVLFLRMEEKRRLRVCESGFIFLSLVVYCFADDVANEENAVNFKFASPLALQWMKQVHDERCSKGQDDVGGVMWKCIDSLHHHLPRKHLVQALTFG